MSRRTWGFVLFAAVVAAGCVRLGMWQLSRLGERRAGNEVIARRLHAAPMAWPDIERDTSAARYRLVSLRGVFDYDREVVLTSRSRRGAPGVQLLTPLRLMDGSHVLVNRGWVYSADGTTVELTRWREGDSVEVSGFVDHFDAPRESSAVSTASNPRAVRRLVRDSLQRRMGVVLAPVVVVRRDGAEFSGEVQHPFRLELPVLNDGSHKSYALQWFSFAVIALVGTAVVIRKGRTPGRDTRGRA